MKTALKMTAKPTSLAKSQQANAMLNADHKPGRGLFFDDEIATTKIMKKKLASQICMELSGHAPVEEEICR